LIFGLKQVKAYVHDEVVKAAVLARVAEQITDDVRVIVAHSLGTVVAYEALCVHPEWPVRALITLGSPLGMPTLIFDRLRPQPTNGLGAWPGSIQSWTNVVDRRDPVALVKDLAPLFGDRVETIPVDNGPSAHCAIPYLTARETGAAIIRALSG
jgi:pimeloyl-ACP methyl ester carboxylesterase